MFYGGNLVMLHSVIDYVASEIFIGLVTEEKLMILTHNCQLFEIDSIFGVDGYHHGQFIIVGFQDSLMLFSDDLTVIHWEVIALNKCRKTVYSLSEKLDCLSELNQIFATLNRIPFLIGNETPLKIKRLSSYFLTPIKTDLATWIYTGKLHRKTFSSKSCQEYLNKEIKMSSYSRNIDDNFNFSEEHKSINENLCNIEAQNSETSSSQFEEPNNSAICSDQVQIFEPLSQNEICHQLISDDVEKIEQKPLVYERHQTGALLFFSKIISGINSKNKSLGFYLIKQRRDISKKLSRLDLITKRSLIRSSFAVIKTVSRSIKSIEGNLMKIKRDFSILNLYESFNKLKMHKFSCEWNERITKTESNFMKTNEYLDDLESSISPAKQTSTFNQQRILERRGSMKSITYFQRQDFNSRDAVEPKKNYIKYKPINSSHQNWIINQHINTYHKFENSLVERLEKSVKTESIFKVENITKRNHYHKKSFNERVTKFIKSAQKSRQTIKEGCDFEIVPKEENYLLNEIIEHILSTQNNSKIQWNRIRASPFKTARNYSRDYRSTLSTKYTLDHKTESFKRCQSSSRILVVPEETAEPIEIEPKNQLEANLFEFNKDSGSKTFGSGYESNSLNHSKHIRSNRIETKIQLSANRLSSKKQSSAKDDTLYCGTSEDKLNIDHEYNSQSSKENSSINDPKRQLIFTQNESVLNESASYSSRKNIENNSNNISIEKDPCCFKDMFVLQNNSKNSQIVKLIEQEKLKRNKHNDSIKGK